MAVTPSNMLPLGTQAPDFILTDVVSDKKLSLNELKSDVATVIMFICNHCPYVKHMQQGLVKLSNDYKEKKVSFVAISSNDPVHYPEDAPEKMKQVALSSKYTFPYLFDESQEVAKAYQAACTPDFYVFDKNLKCVYRGQLDEARPKNQIPVTGADVRNALDALIQGKAVDPNQKPSVGCSIKWKN